MQKTDVLLLLRNSNIFFKTTPFCQFLIFKISRIWNRSNPENTKNTTKSGLKSPHFNKQERRKEKRRRLSKTPSFFLFLSSSFVFITHHHLHKQTKNKKQNFLKFWIILLFGRCEEFELVVIRVRVKVWIFDIFQKS